MKRITYFVLSLCLAVYSFAQDSLSVEQLPAANTAETTVFSVDVIKAEADSSYMKNDFVNAIRKYEDILKHGEASEIYYNLGNSYYKANDIARAILNYERALLLNPGNGDIRSNLEIARGKTVDKVEEVPDIFFVSWIKSLINTTTADTWAKWGIVFFILFLIAAYFFIFSKKILIKKIGFVSGIIFILFVFCTNSFAAYQKDLLVNRNTAIVVSPSVTVRSTPNESGTNLFILHEGKKVIIKDNSMKSWKEIVLEDGKVGWLEASEIEII